MTGESAIVGLLLPGALPKTTHNNNTLCLKKTQALQEFAEPSVS